MAAFWTRFSRDRRGATALEYGLICALVFLVALSAMSTFGTNATAMFNRVGAAIVDVP